jgi:hypothetical protein
MKVRTCGAGKTGNASSCASLGLHPISPHAEIVFPVSQVNLDITPVNVLSDKQGTNVRGDVTAKDTKFG